MTKQDKDQDYNPSPAMNDPWIRLAQAVAVQALADLTGGNRVNAWDALIWMTGSDARTYLEAAGIDLDPVTILAQPPDQLRNSRTRVKSFTYRRK